MNLTPAATARAVVPAALLLVAGVWAWGLAAAPVTVRTTVLYHTEPIGEIRGAATVGQSFAAPYDGLYRIEVSLADYGRANSGPVEFRLFSAPPGDPAAVVLAAQTLPAETVRGDVMAAFDFSPQPESGGRLLYFELAAPAATEGNALTAYVQPSDPYPDGTVYRGGAAAAGDLVFVLHFKVGGWQRVSILLRQMAAGRPGPWGWAGFPIVLLLAYAALAAGLVWAVRRRPAA
jgi:hypothetical protein